MRRIGLKPAIAAALLLLVACGESPTEPAPDALTELPRALSTTERSLIAASNTFAIGLLRQVHSATPKETVFLSPFSASMALGMTMNGAQGATLDQMKATLGFGTMPMADIDASYRSLLQLLGSLDSRVDLRVANALFYRAGFQLEAPFLASAKDYFGAQVQGLDFNAPAAAVTINDWVKTATAGRIDGIVDPPIDRDVMAMLLNAVYFKGDWRNRFDAGETTSAPFQAPGGSRSVSMMHVEKEMPFRTGPGWIAADVPYGAGAWSMTVAVPTQGATLDAVSADLPSILDPDARWSQVPVSLYLPKLELSWDRLLNDDLRALGMVDAFDDVRADFSAMSRSTHLVIATVRQKTFLSVDEKGTEAAAVTYVGVVSTAAPVTQTVRADRPFLIAIRERLTGTVLFAGYIVQAPGA